MKADSKTKTVAPPPSTPGALHGTHLEIARQLAGPHRLALEYLVAQQVLLGYTARGVLRNIGHLQPDMKAHVDKLSPGTVQDLFERAMSEGLVEVKTPDRPDVAKALHSACLAQYKRSVNFHVADDSIGLSHSQSRSPFFWRLAADLIVKRIAEVGKNKNITGDVNIGNTGGPSIAAAAELLSAFQLDREFLQDHSHRLWFLSLSGAGSARGFDEHANFIATQLSRAYRGQHLALVGNDPPGPNYRSRVENMHLIISGLGAETSYLSDWITRHKVTKPPGMIGDIFLNPVNADGDLLEVPQEVLDKLMLRPTHAEIVRLLSRQKPPLHTLIIVQERREPNGSLFQDKTEVLDAVIRRGYVHDCVLGSDLAFRLLTRMEVDTSELKKPKLPPKLKKSRREIRQKPR